MTTALIGRRKEKCVLAEALRNSSSLAVVGPKGIGKSVLIESVFASQAPLGRLIFQPFLPSLHEMLGGIAASLSASGHSGIPISSRREFQSKTSVQLRGVLLRALTLEPWSIVIEDVDRGGLAHYRFAQQLFHMAGVSLVVSARSVNALGYLARLFWNPADVMEVPRLSRAESITLFEGLCAKYNLGPLAIDELRRDLLRSNEGIPGRIVELCNMAADSRYRIGPHIRTASISMELARVFSE